MPIDPETQKSEPQVAFPSTAGQQTAPTTGAAVDSNDAILRKWLEIWNGTREKTFRPDGEGGGSWWEDDEEYPETVRTGGSNGPSALVFKHPSKYGGSPLKEKISPPFKMPEYPDVEGGPGSYYQPTGNVWENTWSATKDRYGEMIDIGMSVKGESYAETMRRRRQAPPDPQALKKVAGVFGEAAKFAFVGMSDALKRAIGWTVEMNAWAPAEKALASGLDTPFAYNLLIEGEYAEAVRRQSMQTAGPGTRPKETASTKAAYEKAKRLQEEYDSIYQQNLKSGLSKERAAKEAAMSVTKRQVELEHTAIGSPKPDIGAPSTRDNPFGLTQETRDSWAEAEGFRYTHIADPAKARQYEQLRLAGVPAEEAGTQTEDPVVEATWQLILDPNWILPLDNLVVGAGWEIVKGTGKGLLGIASKTPILKGGIEWATEITATTAANYAARYADDALRQVKRYADETGQIISPEFVETILRNPPEDFLRTLTVYDHRALRGAYDQVDSIVSAVKKSMDTKSMTESLELAIKATPGADTRVLQQAVNDEAWVGALKRAAAESYVAGKEVYYAAHPFAEKMGKSNWFKRTLTEVKGVMVDTWLGVRPSWNVFNATDNMVKLLLDGVNPFQSIPSLLKRYALYSPDFAKTADAALGELKGMHFWNISTTNNKRYVELLHELYKKQAIGSFGQTALSVEGGGSILRKAPVIGNIIDWNTSLGGRIEAAAHARAFTTFFLKELDEGWGALVKREVAATVGGVATKVSDEVAAPIVAKLRTMRNPTVEGVRNIIDSSIMRPSGNIVSPTMGAEFGRTLPNIDTGIANDVEKAINRLTNLGSSGPQPVAKDVDRIFSKAEAQVNAAYKEKVESGLRAFDDTLPVYPKDADEMYETLLGGKGKVAAQAPAATTAPTVADMQRATTGPVDASVVKQALAEGKPAQEAFNAGWRGGSVGPFVASGPPRIAGTFQEHLADAMNLPAPAPGNVRLWRVGSHPAFSGKQVDWIIDAQKESGMAAASGRWFTPDPEILEFYIKEHIEDAALGFIDVPESAAEASRLVNAESVVQRFSRDLETENFVSRAEAKQIVWIGPDTAQDMVKSGKYGTGPAEVWKSTKPAAPALSVPAASTSGPTLQELAQAIDDMPMIAHRANLESTRMSNAHWEHMAELRRTHASAKVKAKAQDDFLLAERDAWWKNFSQVQEDASLRIMDEIDTRLSLQGIGEKFPRTQMRKYLDAGKAITDAQQAKYTKWRSTMIELNSGSLLKAERDALMDLSRKETDELWNAVYPKAKADVHDSLVAIREWFETSVFKDSTDPSMVELAKGTGWWRVGQQIDDITVEARKFADAQLQDLQSWKKVVMEKRSTPYEEIPMADADREALRLYRDQMMEDVHALISSAENSAMKQVGELLFDYETTQNWMSLLGAVFPFVRFPAKNIPLWAGKFAEVPHLAGAIYNVRALQAAINRDLPSRHRYSIKLNPKFLDPLMSAIGLDNFELRVNPWSFISIFQQFPGATAFSARKLEEMMLDSGDEETKQGLRVFSTLAGEFGFGMWPYLEWIAGSFGWLGQDWYPRDALGTWAPVTDFVVKEAFGYDKNFSIDRFMRANATDWWNTLFGGTELDWNQLNPDLFQEWAKGKEIEGIIMAMPEPAAAALAAITPTQAYAVVKAMPAAQREAMLPRVVEVFKMPPQQLAQAIAALTPEEQALFLVQMDIVAMRNVVRKRFATGVIGNVAGLYIDPMRKSEIEATQMRADRRAEAQKLAPGAERREMMSQWYEEHPKYSMISNWRFDEHPWAETAAGEEIEKWDATLNQFKTKYYDFSRGLTEKEDALIAETYARYPGDILRLKALKASFREQRAAYVEAMNAECKAALEAKLHEYEMTYPHDKAGIEKLRKGWTTAVYVGTQLNEEERQQLATFEEVSPDDEEGYNTLFQKLYDQASKRTPETQMKHIPGLDEGLSINLEFSPAPGGNYSEEELQEFLVGDVLQELYDGGPQREEFPGDYDMWWEKRNEYLENLTAEAMKTDLAKKQVTLMVQQGMSQTEAEATVASWYEVEDLQRIWRKDHTIWEALEYVYDNHIVSEADDEYFGEITSLQDADYDLYSLRKEDLDMRYGQQEAGELIKYIMQDYPGKWTVRELQIAFQDVVMPSYFERLTLRASGEKGVDSNIWLMYNKMSADDKLVAREQLGPLFSDQFLKGNTEAISVTLRGQWLNALSTSVGTPMDWRSLPGIDMAPSKEAVDFGLPNVGQRDEAEFAQARIVNQQYWQAKVAGDEMAVEKLEADPLRQKWFGLSSASSYFWNLYYTQLPPGPFAKELKDGGFLKLLLDKPVREVAATNSDYDRATRAIEEFLEKQQGVMKALDLRPEEYDEVRRMTTEYYAIPQEDKNSRKAYLKANPLLKKYFDAEAGVADAMGEIQLPESKVTITSTAKAKAKTGTTARRSSGGGGGGSSGGGGVTNPEDVWTSFRAAVGGSYVAVLRMLSSYWETGTMTPTASAYLQKLYAQTGEGLSFEEWLNALREGWAAQRAPSVRVPSVPRTTTARTSYSSGKGTSGIRR